MRAVVLLAACFALACGGRGPWRAISREAETAADIISQREGGALTAPLRAQAEGHREAAQGEGVCVSVCAFEKPSRALTGRDLQLDH